MSPSTFSRVHSSDLRKGRISDAFACYVVTKAVNRRLPILATDRTAKILMDSWQFLRSNNRIKLFAFCIMPDHFHLAFCLMPGGDISKVMKDSGKFTARELNRLLGRRGTFWQEGFHDHRCRSDVELHEYCSYIEHNPVRKGFVVSAEIWQYSSAFRPNSWMLDRDWWP